MDMYKLKWTRLQLEIVRFLSIKAGQDFNLRKVAQALAVSPTAVSNVLEDLEKDSYISVKKSNTMNLMSIQLNRDNKKAIEFKRTENLRLIYDSGLADFLYELFPGCAIILFGSYSRGEDVYGSDIDVAVVGMDEKRMELKKYESLLERKISINFYKSWAKIHTHLKENIINGITLSGGIEL
ncbi:MAG TPA: nucleotidyltransferase domain-containing protein [Candidatus Nanoarchaeia archaeon]|nr:nucleotidyltransferase domain-containing protein [Candidatus Nanoarchaeia archaeon]